MPNLDMNPDHSPEPAGGEADGLAVPGEQAPLDLSHQQGAEPIQPATDLDCFEADWVFEIHRDKVDSNLIQVRGVQTNHIYFEISGKTDNYSAWQQAERVLDEYRSRKLPNFTREKALECESCFMVHEDYEAEPSTYKVVGYQTKFVFFTSEDRRKASEICDDMTDSKLTPDEKVLQVHEVNAHGGFPVHGRDLSVGDPTCGMGRDASVVAANGTWNGFSIRVDTGDWGKRNAVLLALKDDFSLQPGDAWEEFGVVGVDGGMAAITASPHDREGETGNYNDGLCGATGVQCGSGFGDGGYGAYAIKRDGVAVAVGVIFLAPLERYEKAFLDSAVAAALRQS